MGAERETLKVPGPKWGQNSGPLVIRPQLSLLHRLCPSWKETDYNVYPENIAMALSGPTLWSHVSGCGSLWEGGIPLSMGRRQKGATVQEMPLRPRGMFLEEKAPELLPSPGLLLIPCPQPPLNTTICKRPRPTKHLLPQVGEDGGSSHSMGQPSRGTLTAGVLGTAIRLFKVVLCFAFYSPTESTFCWVGDRREQEKMMVIHQH